MTESGKMLMKELKAELEMLHLRVGPQDFVQLVLLAIASQRRALTEDRKSKPLGKAERRLYMAGGFDPQNRKRAAEGPLARSLAAYAAMVADALSVKEAAQRLGLRPDNVRRKIRFRALYGMRDRSRWLLPRFQFSGGEPLPGLAVVVPVIQEDLHPLSVQRFFLTPQVDLADELSGGAYAAGVAS